MLAILIFSGLCVALVYLFYLYTSRNFVVVSGIPGPSFYQLLQHTFRNRRHFGDIVKMLNSFHDVYGPTFCIHVKPFPPLLVTGDHSYFGQILASKEHLTKAPIYDFFRNAVGDSLLVSHNALKDPSIAWDPEKTNEYNRSATSFKNFLFRNMTIMVLNLQKLFEWTTKFKTAAQNVKTMRQFAIDLIDLHLNSKQQLNDPDNIIYKMYEANMPYERIVDNIVLFIEAGHETTSTTLAYLLFEIAKMPDVQNKILTEVEAVVGKDPNAPISTSDLQQMRYIHCVVKEGLRINSTLSYIMRKLDKPAVVNDITVPNGTNIIFNMEVLHKSDKYFKDPYVFDPEKFSDENKPNFVRYSWAPFSLGIRNCLGKSLAMQQIKLILVKMIRRFEFTSVVPEHKMDIKAALLAKSMNGVPVFVKVRDEKEIRYTKRM